MKKNVIDIFRNENHPVVVQVLPAADYKVYVYFNDGTIHLADIKPLIKSGTVFEPLQDPEFFRIRATVLNDTLAWDVTGDYNPQTCIDLALEFLYSFPEVDDPLDASENTDSQKKEDDLESNDVAVVFIPASKVSLARKMGINLQNLIETALNERLGEAASH